jgi:transcription initiation factor IIE alpha subunit
MPAIGDLDGLDQRIVAYVRTLGPKDDGKVRITGHGLARDLGADVEEVRQALRRLAESYLRAERRMEPTSEHWDVYAIRADVTG